MSANQSPKTYFEKAFEEFQSKFHYEFTRYWFKCKNKNLKQKDSRIATSLTKYDIISNQNENFNQAIFIEITKTFFNNLKHPNVSSSHLSQYIIFHYKDIEDKDKPVFLNYIDYVFSGLPIGFKLGSKNQEAFRTWMKKEKNSSIRNKVEYLITENITKVAEVNSNNYLVPVTSKGKTKAIAHSFQFNQPDGIEKQVGLREDLKDLFHSLVNNNFIDPQTKLLNFQKIFTGTLINPKNRIKWIGAVVELKYLINTLYPLLDCGREKWQIAIKCFAKNEGSEYDPRKIDKTKENEIIRAREKNLKKYISSIKDSGNVILPFIDTDID